MMAARVGDMTAHGGTIIVGLPTVLIGITAQAAALKVGANTAAPFMDICS